MKIRLLTFFLSLFTAHLISQENTALFQLLSSQESGITFKNQLVENNKYSVMDYDYFYNGAGVGIADFDNDGLLDIFLAGNQVEDKLYKNIGNLRFIDVSKDAGINVNGWSVGVSIVDINNDGLADIYLSRSGPILSQRKNALYINLGGLKFREAAEEYGLDIKAPATQTAFLDYDRDGDLDAYMITHPDRFKNKDDLQTFIKNVQDGKVQSDYLLRNDNGKFIDVTKEAGILEFGYSLGIAIADFNNDSWPDIFVGNDFDEPDLLLLNNRKGGFTDIAKSAFKHTSNYSMGCDAADINNDGFMDIGSADMSFTSHYRSKTNMPSMQTEKFDARVKLGWNYQYMSNVLQINTGLGTFSEVAQLSGIHKTDWSWAFLMVDLNGDQKKDVFVSNGYKRDTRFNDLPEMLNDLNQSGGVSDINDFLDLIPETLVGNFVFENQGLYEFEDKSKDWGFTDEMHSHGVAYADLDNDGDLDLVINNVDKESVVYRNNLDPSEYITLKIPSNNAEWLNTRFYSLYENDTLIYDYQSVHGYASSMGSDLIFYPNENGELPEAIYYRDRFNNYQNIPFVDGKAIAGKNKQQVQFRIERKDPNYFIPSKDNAGIKTGYSENSNDDYALQRLLPHMLSVAGPYIAQKNVLDNGKDELFVSSSVGNSGSFMIQDIYGNYNSYSLPDIVKDAGYEDEGCTFIDANSDGIQDLFISSGGGTYEPGNLENADRLYLGNGQGNFNKKEIENLSYVNGGTTITGDFNGDSIEDILVAGRVFPNNYPLPAPFTLWLGNGQTLSEKNANTLFPGINELGMIQDIVFIDLDKDGFKDLVCTGHWMGVVVYFGNKKGLYEEAIEISNKTKGWFNCLEIVDLNGDGLLDIVLGNEGMNNKFRASKDHPLSVYLNDFDNSGTQDIVLVHSDDDDELFPVRGKECSTEQVPLLSDRIDSYDDFAKSTVQEIYTSEALEQSYFAECNEFRHGVLYQDKSGYFTFIPLPHSAQISPILDWESTDLNEDGKLDLIGVGNRFQTEVETPRGDAGTGVVLIQSGNNEWNYLMPAESGFYVPFNSRQIKKVNRNGIESFIIGNNHGPLISIDRKK